MKRRRAGVVHTNWDNLWTRWSGNQRWWEGSGDWKSFVKTAEDLCRKILLKDVDTRKGSPLLEEIVRVQSKAEGDKEREENEGKGEAENLESRLEKSEENSDS